MSTRCNIIITDKSKDKLIFYRHSDGYPEGTLPTLKKFMSWVRDEKIRNNVPQAAGWLIMIGATEYGSVYVGAGKYEQKPTVTEPQIDLDHITGWQVGAYEPTTDIHSDIEYLYTLDLSKLTITVQEVTGKNKYKTIDTIKDFSEPKPEQTQAEVLASYDPEALEIT